MARSGSAGPCAVPGGGSPADEDVRKAALDEMVGERSGRS